MRPTRNQSTPFRPAHPSGWLPLLSPGHLWKTVHLADDYACTLRVSDGDGSRQYQEGRCQSDGEGCTRL
jgi:hypothetical protein